jgi:hypothetical protein
VVQSQIGGVVRKRIDNAYSKFSTFALLLVRSGSLRDAMGGFRRDSLSAGQRGAYPERFAQEALGHNSKAVHRAYAKRAVVKLPSLEQYETAHEQRKLVPVRFAVNG